MPEPDPISDLLAALQAAGADDAALAAAVRAAGPHLRARLAEADHDPLTGLLNRRGLARAFRPGALALAFFDLVGLKAFNTARGYAAGDAALCEVAAALRGSVRAGDLLARWGGDEFVALLYPRGAGEAGLDAGAFPLRVQRRLEQAAPGLSVRAGVVPAPLELAAAVAQAAAKLD